MANTAPTIMVLGATGYTGRLVAAELQRKKLPFGLAARQAEKLELLVAELKLESETPRRVADALRPETLSKLFEGGTRVLINCAGPFTSLGEPVVKAAIAHGCHYLDITGEQNFIARVYTAYHLAALNNKVAVVPACGAEYSLSNWAAALASRGLEPLDRLTIVTATRGVKTSRGTRHSVFAAMSSFGIGWRGSKRVLKLAGSEVKRFELPSPFGSQTAIWVPFGDPVTLPRHLKAGQIDSFMAVSPLLARAAQLGSPFLPVLSPVAGFLTRGLINRSSPGPAPGTRKASRWAVQATARGPQGNRTVNLTGADVYGITAVIIAWAAGQLLAPDFSKAGVLDPAQAFDPEKALAYLKEFGLEVIAS